MYNYVNLKSNVVRVMCKLFFFYTHIVTVHSSLLNVLVCKHNLKYKDC